MIAEKNKLTELVLAIFFVCLMQPVYLWDYNLFALTYLTLLLLFLKVEFNNNKERCLGAFFFITLLIFPISHNQNIFGYFAFVSFFIIPFVNPSYIYNTFRLYKRILALITFFSIVVWVLVVLLNVQLPRSVVPPLNKLKNYDYFVYPFLAMSMNLGDLGSIVRFCCIFDEPGVVGTYSLLMLFADNFNFKRKENIVFLIAGIISFSFFFYLGIIAFFLFQIMTGKSNMKYKILSVIFSFFIIVGIQSIPVVNDIIGNRFEFDNSTGKFVGDNRSTEALDSYINSIRGSSKYLWGDTPARIEEFSNAASLKNAILRYGVVILVLYFIFFWFYSKYRFKDNLKETILFFLMLFVTLYQRPGFMEPTYMMTFVGIIFCRLKNISSNEK